jgi:hypothetical protein
LGVVKTNKNPPFISHCNVLEHLKLRLGGPTEALRIFVQFAQRDAVMVSGP